jgi:multidrug efflux system membrane fusion protein
MGNGAMQVTARSSDSKLPLAQGTLLTPDNAIDATTGTIRLKATFPNENNKLWPGRFVEAQLLLRTDNAVVTLPTEAVQHGPAGLYVYLVTPGSTVQRQPVKAADRGSVMVVTEGLDIGQKVVLDGQSRLENGIHVAATPAPSTARTGQAGG